MKKEIQIKNIRIGKDKPTFILMEAGSNHNGDMDQALKLIDIDHEYGADGIKFQYMTPEKNLSKMVKEAPAFI